MLKCYVYRNFELKVGRITPMIYFSTKNIL